MIFLIDYDPNLGKIMSIQTFDGSQRQVAQERRLELELLHKHDDLKREVVLLEAADEKAIRKTHRRYFADLEELTKLPNADR
jgi:hypothetical protein